MVRSGVAPGEPQRVLLQVADSGVGMDEETRRRCLEPFFTTKGERGTGLGLAMVFGMAQRHGATLEVDSRPGEGTTMRLLFPIGGDAAAATGRLPKLQGPVPGLRILVVDDDPVLRESLHDALQEEGHRVTVAGGGQEGIDAFQAAQRGAEPFDVVLTDLGMPYVDGRQVAAAVRAMAARTPIILLTGWGQGIAAEREIPEVTRVLGKPPRLRELRAALAELTAARGARRGVNRRCRERDPPGFPRKAPHPLAPLHGAISAGAGESSRYRRR